MVKTKNKVLSLMIALVMLVACALTITSCTNGEKLKVMNVDLNPGVEFVLDGKNKVVSVNATNDEGNFIITNATFIGLSAEDAVVLFIQVAKNNGFIDVSITDQELEIEISGEDAETLFNKVNISAQEKFNELNINMQVEFEKISKSDLKELVGECLKELTFSEIANMSEEELINKIKDSREETNDLLSQELKEIYYNSRADEIIKAKADAFKEYVDQASGLQALFLSSFNAAYNLITNTLEELDTIYTEQFLNEDSAYQIAVNDFIAKKKALLQKRVNVITDDIAQLEAEINAAEEVLEDVKTAVDISVKTVRQNLKNALNTIESAIGQISSFLHLDFNAINNKVKNAKDEFIGKFKENFKTYIENNYWKDSLKPEVNA